MELTPKQMSTVLQQVVEGAAQLQARQEMLECIVRALIVETPPAHPLFWKALHTAKSDMDQRAQMARPENPPEIAAAGMALWNVLAAACAPPPSGG